MLDDSSETNFRDPVAVNSSGKNVSFNVTSEPISEGVISGLTSVQNFMAS